jgi:acetyl-CoA carboxylase alpha subunit
VVYVSITPFVGVIGHQVTRDGLIKEKGHQGLGEPSPYREADRLRDLHQRELIEQGK